MNTLIKLNSDLMNAPAGVVVILFAISIGYVLKVAAFFPNNRIPFVVVVFTSIVFPIVELCADLMGYEKHPWLHIPINILIGVILGFVAWTFHAQILRKWVDPYFFVKPQTGSDAITKKDQ